MSDWVEAAIIVVFAVVGVPVANISPPPVVVPPVTLSMLLIRLSELLVIKEVGVACLGKGGDGLLDGLEGLVSGGGGGGGGEGEGSQKGNNLAICFFC